MTVLLILTVIVVCVIAEEQLGYEIKDLTTLFFEKHKLAETTHTPPQQMLTCMDHPSVPKGCTKTDFDLVKCTKRHNQSWNEWICFGFHTDARRCDSCKDVAIRVVSLTCDSASAKSCSLVYTLGESYDRQMDQICMERILFSWSTWLLLLIWVPLASVAMVVGWLGAVARHYPSACKGYLRYMIGKLEEIEPNDEEEPQHND